MLRSNCRKQLLANIPNRKNYEILLQQLQFGSDDAILLNVFCNCENGVILFALLFFSDKIPIDVNDKNLDFFAYNTNTNDTSFIQKKCSFLNFNWGVAIMKSYQMSACVVVVSAFAFATPASATNLFVEARGGPVWLHGSSDTTNGGAAFGGGGVVSDVDFDIGYSVGGLIGIGPFGPISFGLSYDYMKSDVGYIATFPNIGNQISVFDGTAKTNLALANIMFEQPISPTPLSIVGVVGAGVAFNSLNDVTEDFLGGDGTPDALIADGDTTSFAAKGSIRLKVPISNKISFHAGGSVFTLGDFTTGDSRTIISSSSAEPIGPYGIDDVWGVGAEAGMTIVF